MLQGNLTRLGNLFRTLTGSVDFSGIVSGIFTTIISILSYGGVISRILNLNRIYSGVISFSGIVTTPFRYYSSSGQLVFAGGLTRQAFFFRTLISGISPSAPGIGGEEAFFGEFYLDMTLRV